jgi:hypothetical protein
MSEKSTMNILKSGIISKTLAAAAFVVAGPFTASAFAQQSAVSNNTNQALSFAQFYSPVGTWLYTVTIPDPSGGPAEANVLPDPASFPVVHVEGWPKVNAVDCSGVSAAVDDRHLERCPPPRESMV